MKATSFVKQEILAELKNGNMTVLKGLPPVLSLQYGLAVKEDKLKDETPYDDEAMGNYMLERTKPIATLTGFTFFKKDNDS